MPFRSHCDIRNASGVAALLELTRVTTALGNTFVALTLEGLDGEAREKPK